MFRHNADEIDAELAKPENRGVGALMNENTGRVATFVAPVPYWETARNDAGATGTLTDAEVSALTKERDDLIAALPRLKKAERSKATTRINVIEGTLRRARASEESARVNREREQERGPQRYGTPGNGSTAQSVTEAVASAVAAVNAVVGKASAVRLVREVNWDRFLAGFNAEKAANRSKVCCSGPKQYWCGKCKAKAGV